MKKLGSNIEAFLRNFEGDDEALAKARRAAQVTSLWKKAIEAVYGDSASFILEHINAVYIIQEEGTKKLVVYADDSLVRSDIDARQEFIKMELFKFGEHVSSCKILASRFNMKQRRPFAPGEAISTAPVKLERKTLTHEQRECIEACVGGIENEKVRAALRNAMTAEFEYFGGF